ncbi:CTD nuclear envelope phosphatase 1 homolog [Drosophila sulfurigaster albostrigata]|uniref:CTD nuclear envelope phosphatase 1 homolog n=1 Tax=Drosophila sulfurigaster albostrigata TaxID=89887 RepID=UPI002D21AA26|nr:CTD nuclear envelope phosphatase 1 homolog [Drosophila sulfurigaster albostrigata]
MVYKEDFFVKHFYALTTLAILFATLLLLLPNLRNKIQMKLGTMHNKLINYTPVNYTDYLSPVSRRRLKLVSRKTLVLDMDDTLIKSHFHYQKEPWRNRTRKNKSIKPDFSFYIRNKDVFVSVFKRPHLDYFLDCVSKWYNVMIFTAATEIYASEVLDRLETNRKFFQRRFYRQHCIEISGILAKLVSVCDDDPANVVLLDDCHLANQFNAGNAVQIKRYKIGTQDEELLAMLPLLDALRFTSDVRSVLGRVTKRCDCLTTALASMTPRALHRQRYRGRNCDWPIEC